MPDKVEDLIESITKNDSKTPITLEHMFKSLWGIVSMIFGGVGALVVIFTFVFNTFATIPDVNEKFIAKQEYYVKLKETKEPLDKQIKELHDTLEKYKKQYETDIRKARLEYRVERMHDLGQHLKLVDEKLKDHPDDTSLKNYREVVWKEYNRIRNKIDDGVKEIE